MRRALGARWQYSLTAAEGFFQLFCRERERSQRRLLCSEGMPQGLPAAPGMGHARRGLLRPPRVGPRPAALPGGAGGRDGSWPRRVFNKVCTPSLPELQMK